MKISCQCDSNQSNAFVKKQTWIDETKLYVKKKKKAQALEEQKTFQPKVLK